MAKVTAPLMGFGASGSLAKSIVHASWRGVPYVRRHVIPSNPRSPAQTTTRSLFSWLQEVWKRMEVDAQTPWFAFAKGQPLTDRNAFSQANMKAMIGMTDTASIIFSNGAKGGLVPTAVVATAGSHQISVAYDIPTPPTGWTIAGATATVIADQDPQTGSAFDTFTVDDPTHTTPLVITGLTTGTLYHGGIWLRWNKPDGSLGYSPQVPFLGTAT